jgi:hypothetical protein
MGMCINIKIQIGKIAMARKKWAKDFGATRLGSTHAIRLSRFGSCYLLVLTRFMLFARLDPAHDIRSTLLYSCYSLDSTRLMLFARIDLTRLPIRARYRFIKMRRLIWIASSKCGDRFEFRFIKMRRSIWISLHQNVTIDLDLASSKCDDRFGSRFIKMRPSIWISSSK